MCKLEQQMGKKELKKRSDLEDLKGQGGAAAACRFRVSIARSCCLKHLSVLGVWDWWRKKPLESSVRKGSWSHFY